MKISLQMCKRRSHRRHSAWIERKSIFYIPSTGNSSNSSSSSRQPRFWLALFFSLSLSAMVFVSFCWINVFSFEETQIYNLFILSALLEWLSSIDVNKEGCQVAVQLVLPLTAQTLFVGWTRQISSNNGEKNI